MSGTFPGEAYNTGLEPDPKPVQHKDPVSIAIPADPMGGCHEFDSFATLKL